MSRIVTLHGGPMHGKKISIEIDQDHFHIAGALEAEFPQSGDDPQDPVAIPFREGMYSKVFGYPNDFEWDGWRTHE
jgi:hypothetical protein